MRTLPQRLAAVLMTFTVTAASLAVLTSAVRYKPYGVPDILLPKWEAMQVQVTAAEAFRKDANRAVAGQSHTAVPSPIAVTDEVEFDFGLLDPGSSCSHAFTIRNSGEVPLVITPADTSCKCTVSKTSREIIEPGGEASVTLTWNAGLARDFYRQYAIIKTNDPKRREIELIVTGKVKSYLAFDSDRLVTKAKGADGAVEASVVLFSQTLTDFEIADVQCGLPGFAYIDHPVSAAQLQSLDATCGRLIEVTAGPMLASGDFHHTLRVHVRPLPGSPADNPSDQRADATSQNRGGHDLTAQDSDDQGDDAVPESDATVAETQWREIPITVQVPAAISFYGPGLHVSEGLNLGTIMQGVGKSVRLIVRVNSDAPPAELRVGRIEPEFLQATLQPQHTQRGAYTLTIRVPENAPQAIFNLEQNHGSIEIIDAGDPNRRSGFPILGAVLPR